MLKTKKEIIEFIIGDISSTILNDLTTSVGDVVRQLNGDKVFLTVVARVLKTEGVNIDGDFEKPISDRIKEITDLILLSILDEVIEI